jgi:hypothetical protein
MNLPTHICTTECFHYRIYTPGQTVAFRPDAKVPSHFRKLTPEEAAYYAGRADTVTSPVAAPASAAPLDPGLAVPTGFTNPAIIPQVTPAGAAPAILATGSPVPDSEIPLSVSAPPAPTPQASDEAPKTAGKKG